jgi:hypothetical protein
MMSFATDGLKIDWTQMPTYNTIMSVAAGAALITLVWFGRSLLKREVLQMEGWALAFGVPGIILALTGLHMTLTWPFAKYFPYDNIIFGETSLGFGFLLLAIAFYLWRRSGTLEASSDPLMHLTHIIRPLSVFIFGMGLALGAIAFAGLIFQLFAAPPEEPISGAFAQYPWVEAIFMSGLFGIVGVGAVLFPFALPKTPNQFTITPLQWIVGVVWGLSGLAFLLFGALNFFTHIGLIVHTM